MTMQTRQRSRPAKKKTTRKRRRGTARVHKKRHLVDLKAFYVVPSKSEEGHFHVVTRTGETWRCPCKGFEYRKTCSHCTLAQQFKAGQRPMGVAQLSYKA